MKPFLRLFSRHALYSDGEIELVLSNEDVADDACGITDGFTFYIYHVKPWRYAGYVSFRIGESPELYYLGHIGYRVQEEWRGHGYAARACKMLMPLIRKMHIPNVVITTNVDNTPSRKTCEKLGCTLEHIAPVPSAYRKIVDGARYKCRYIWHTDVETPESGEDE